MSNRLLIQEKKSKNKLYSLHEPTTYCIAKGKARSPYEYGHKVSLVVTHKQGLALSSQALEKCSYDGHVLSESVDKAKEISGNDITKIFVDRGYRGHGITDKNVYISGQRKGMTASLRKELKRRSAIEPHIGHMKSEGKLAKNYLKGIIGSKINALMCAIGHNLRMIWRHIMIFLAQILNQLSKVILSLISQCHWQPA